MQKKLVTILVLGVMISLCAEATTKMKNKIETLEGGVKREWIRPPAKEGVRATKGKAISVHYVGTLKNGKQFDSSRDRGKPFTFVLGMGQVIQGWDKGLLGLRENDLVKLTIPPKMGYGDRAMGDKIPSNSTLIFEVEVKEIN